jgi:Tol biopolymer transport system component/DNA-binding winged helix-turn-helix (wHTH) protein
MPLSQQEEGSNPLPLQNSSKELLEDIVGQAEGQVYAFGVYRLDARECRLWHGDVLIALPPKAFDLLRVLVQHAGQLMEKEALLRAVWPNTFVEEGNLSVHISALRKVFSKESSDSAFIETIPKRGYRFTAAVTRSAAESDLSPQEERAVSLGTEGMASAVIYRSTFWGPRFWRKPLFWMLLLSLCAVAVLATRFTTHPTKPPRVAADSRPLTSVPGVFSSPTFSPDGRRLAYAWHAGADKFQNIYTQDVDSDERNKLTDGGGDNFSPAWSPRGEEIAFLHSENESKMLKIVVAEVQAAHVQRQLAVINNIGSTFHDPPSLAWSPTGESLVTTEKDDSTQSASLVLISTKSGGKQLLTHPPVQAIDIDAVFSPDGNLVAFLRAHGPSSADIYVIPTGAGPERHLPFQIHSIEGLTWSPDGHSLVVSSGRAASVGSLWKVSLNGDPPTALSSLPAHTSDPTISPTAHRLAYVDLLRNASLWRMPADGVGQHEQLVASDYLDSAPDYSPDGSHIAFVSDRSGATEIWVCRSDGTEPRRVTNFFGPMTGSPRWSPDGRMLAFDSRLNGRSAMFIVEASGGTPTRNTTGAFEAADNVVPSWSHDGQSLYFSSNRTGRWEIWRKRISGDDENRITRQGGFNGVESSDGKSLYYVQDTVKTTIWRVPLTGGESRQVSEALGHGMWGYWTVAGETLFYAQRTASGSAPAAIFRLNLKTGSKVKLGETQFGVNVNDKGLAISPDGRWLLYAQRDVDRSRIMLVNNWY